MYIHRVNKTKIHPFLQTTDTIPSSDLSNKKYAVFFFLYIDSLRIVTAQNNLVAGDLKTARDVIFNSNTNYTLLIKSYIFILYFFPKIIINYFHPFFNFGGAILIFVTNSTKPIIECIYN